VGYRPGTWLTEQTGHIPDTVAISPKTQLRPSADCDWVWVALGWPKGHPSVTQGPRKGHARATQAPRRGHPSVELRKCFVCNKSWEKAGWGVKKIR
jgi:hypothetical protein